MEKLNEVIELFKPAMTRYDEVEKNSHICIFKDNFIEAAKFVDTLEGSGLPVEIFQSGAYTRITLRVRERGGG